MDWLALIWTASKDRGSEVEKAIDCLKFCSGLMGEYEFSYSREYDVYLRDASGKVLCISHDWWPLLGCILGEVLVNAWLTGQDAGKRGVAKLVLVTEQGGQWFDDETLDLTLDAGELFVSIHYTKAEV